MIPLKDKAFGLLSDLFDGYRTPLQGQHREALEAFIQTLDQGLRGLLDPQFYLLSLDPGMGKTKACACFLKAWKENNFSPSSSIIIGVSRLEEIPTYIEAAGLGPHEFGVLTSAGEYNGLGASFEEQSQTKILFTTQQMIRSRTIGKTFAQASDFHYQGQPRVLRLWDENILPANPQAIRVDELRGLAGPLRPKFPEFVEQVAALAETIDDGSDNDIIVMPTLRDLQVPFRNQIRPGLLSENQAKLLDALPLLAGHPMVLAVDERYGRTLIGATRSLPDDIAPLIVIDASGRVQETYRLWEKHRGTLTRLPGAGNSFHQLNVFVWKTRAGKDALEVPEQREKIAENITKEIKRRDPTGNWLIITYKDTADDLISALEEKRGLLHKATIRVLTWGRHLGTNDFRDVENVVIVGQFTYPQTAYRALALAASGLPPSRESELDLTAIRHGEHLHHLLQGLCRASVRKAAGGVAGRCNAFLITTLGGINDTIEAAFPGAQTSEWYAPDQRTTGRIDDAIDILREHFADGTKVELSKASIRTALGMSPPNFSNNVVGTSRFKTYLADNDLELAHYTIRSNRSPFPPIES